MSPKTYRNYAEIDTNVYQPKLRESKTISPFSDQSSRKLKQPKPRQNG